MGLFSDLFGGTDTSAQREQIRANRATAEDIGRLSELARADVQRIFPQALFAQQQGAQAGLDVFGQTIPQQISALQQGNVAAQETGLRGLQGARNAILGIPQDFSLQNLLSVVNPINVDTSFAQQQLPNFQQPQQAPQQQQIDLSSLFGGRF